MADPSGTTAPSTTQTTSANTNVNPATAKPAARAGGKKKSPKKLKVHQLVK